MNQSILEIATARKIPYHEAEEFCRAVFRHFVGPVPKYEAVAQAVTDRPAASSREIAQTLGANRPPSPPKLPQPVNPPQPEPPVWLSQTPPPSVPAEPTRLGNAEPPAWLPGQSPHNTPKYKSPFRRIGFPAKKTFLPTTTKIPLSQEPLPPEHRVDPDASRKCIHGVPFYKRCHICKPDEFGS